MGSDVKEGKALKTSYSNREVLGYCVHNPNSARRLPAPPLLMFDRVTEIRGDGGKFDRGFVTAEKDVRFDEWFFFSHFQGDPVMPGILQLDAILQLGGFFVMHAGFEGYGRALRTGKIVFREQVRPHNKLITYRLQIRKMTAKPTPIAVADAVAEVDGQLSVEVESLMVGIFPDLRYAYP